MGAVGARRAAPGEARFPVWGRWGGQDCNTAGTRQRGAGHPGIRQAWPLRGLPRPVCRYGTLRAVDLGSRELTGPILEGSRLQPWGCRGGRGCSTERVLLRPREGDHYVATHTIPSRRVGETPLPLPSVRAPRPAWPRGHGPPAQLAALARPVVSNASPSDWCRPAACAMTSPGRIVAIKAWPGRACSSFPELGRYGTGGCVLCCDLLGVWVTRS